MYSKSPIPSSQQYKSTTTKCSSAERNQSTSITFTLEPSETTPLYLHRHTHPQQGTDNERRRRQQEQTKKELIKEEKEIENKIFDKSLLVIYILTVVAEAARGLVLPTLWPYFASVGGTKASLGILVSVYSLGRMLSVVPLGHLSDSLSAPTVLNIASVLQAFGNFLYCISNSTWMLYLARTIIGFGSATTSIARAYVTKKVPHEKRTCYLAYLSGLQFIGFAVLPVAGGVMPLLPKFSFMSLQFNVFTYPAWILVFANLFCVYLVNKFYKDPIPPTTTTTTISSPNTIESTPTTTTTTTNNTTYSTISSSSTPINKPDFNAIFICLLINLVFRGVLAQLETISIPFMTEQFHITPSTASIYMSIIGVLGAILYFCFKPLSNNFSDRNLVLIGLLFIALGCLPLSIHSITQYMNLYVYLVLLAFTWSIAYPVGQTSILALFSKTLKGYNVGSFMGVFSASGAISPLILSVVASWMWETWGRESVFGFTFLLVLMALGILSSAYSTLNVENDLKPHINNYNQLEV